MSESDKSQKTEAPSKRKLEQAREQGQVARSQDLPSAVSLTVSVVMFGIFLPILGRNFTQFFISNAFDFPLTELSQQGFAMVMIHYFKTFLIFASPILLIIWLVTIMSIVAQVGFKISFKAIEPSIEKINPISGFKKLASTRSLVKTLLSVIKMIVLTVIASSVMIIRQNEIAALSLQNVMHGLQVIGSLAWEIGMKAGIALLILALVDYFYQKWQFSEDQKMTKQEVKEEYKQQEGDPHIKGQIRAKQRAAANQRGLRESVEQADVVITNPYHLAVAIKYDRFMPDSAPFVVAKGARLLAQRIREFAKESDVDIVQNIPLARALYKECRVDMEVPPEFYVAVAEVLALVYKKRN